MTFDDLSLNKNILRNIETLGWENPTPIQEKSIPLSLSGQDVVGIAQTGTGKTGAFLLPIIHKLGYRSEESPRAIVFAPTKELALQIGEHFDLLNPFDQLKKVVLVGGKGLKHQVDAFSEGVDVIVATPGRFMEVYKKSVINVKKIQVMVLDEADRLMDMGFMPQLRSLLEVIPVKRQNMLFSATYPPKVEELSHEFLDFPTRIEIEEQSTPAETVEQYFYAVNGFKTKLNLLTHLVLKEEFSKVIVFANKKQSANGISEWLKRSTKKKVSLVHSNKSQTNRGVQLSEFDQGETDVLITTNVSSRGLDIPDVSHVINFDLPQVYEDYVHRIGRTGRAFKVGEAISFANKYERMQIERYATQLDELTFPKNEVDWVEIKKEELIEIERNIDRLKKRENPDYKGAFHEKKKKFPMKKSVSKSKRRKKR